MYTNCIPSYKIPQNIWYSILFSVTPNRFMHSPNQFQIDSIEYHLKCSLWSCYSNPRYVHYNTCWLASPTPHPLQRVATLIRLWNWQSQLTRNCRSCNYHNGSVTVAVTVTVIRYCFLCMRAYRKSVWQHRQQINRHTLRTNRFMTYSKCLTDEISTPHGHPVITAIPNVTVNIIIVVVVVIEVITVWRNESHFQSLRTQSHAGNQTKRMSVQMVTGLQCAAVRIGLVAD